LLKPASTAEVSAVLRICHDTGNAIVTQGGNTGLVGGQIPFNGEVLLTTKRLNKLRGLDQGGMTMTVEAGVTLAEVQRAAEEAHLLFPSAWPRKAAAPSAAISPPMPAAPMCCAMA